MISAHADKSDVIEALNVGAAGYLQKPIDPRELLYTVRHWVEFSKMKEESGQDRYYWNLCNCLKENLAGYRQLVELIPVAVLIHDRKGRVLYINPAGTHMLGASHALALVEKNVLEFVHRGDAPVVRRLRQKIKAGISGCMDEIHCLRCDGSVFPVEVQVIPSYFEQQQAVLVVLRPLPIQNAEKRINSTPSYL